MYADVADGDYDDDDCADDDDGDDDVEVHHQVRLLLLPPPLLLLPLLPRSRFHQHLPPSVYSYTQS